MSGSMLPAWASVQASVELDTTSSSRLIPIVIIFKAPGPVSVMGLGSDVAFGLSRPAVFGVP